jgi:isopentenyl-diphosphate delta-isomerase
MTSDLSADPRLEQVVLLDDARRPIGAMPKADVHTTSTPLHLAFSCYLVDDAGRVLLTRRALGKQTWPGVWTNTCCGHPAPGEDPQDAVCRRLEQELSVQPDSLELVLPDFAYRAVAPDGLVENEVCPVWVAGVGLGGDPLPDPAEVAEWAWLDRSALVDLARTAPRLLSPWAALQVPALAAAGWGSRRGGRTR